MEQKTPRLLTEAQVREIYECLTDASDLVRLLDKHGLIADESKEDDQDSVECGPYKKGRWDGTRWVME